LFPAREIYFPGINILTHNIDLMTRPKILVLHACQQTTIVMQNKAKVALNSTITLISLNL